MKTQYSSQIATLFFVLCLPFSHLLAIDWNDIRIDVYVQPSYSVSSINAQKALVAESLALPGNSPQNSDWVNAFNAMEEDVVQFSSLSGMGTIGKLQLSTDNWVIGYSLYLSGLPIPDNYGTKPTGRINAYFAPGPYSDLPLLRGHTNYTLETSYNVLTIERQFTQTSIYGMIESGSQWLHVSKSTYIAGLGNNFIWGFTYPYFRVYFGGSYSNTLWSQMKYSIRLETSPYTNAAYFKTSGTFKQIQRDLVTNASLVLEQPISERITLTSQFTARTILTRDFRSIGFEGGIGVKYSLW